MRLAQRRFPRDRVGGRRGHEGWIELLLPTAASHPHWAAHFAPATFAHAAFAHAFAAEPVRLRDGGEWTDRQQDDRDERGNDQAQAMVRCD